MHVFLPWQPGKLISSKMIVVLELFITLYSFHQSFDRGLLMVSLHVLLINKTQNTQAQGCHHITFKITVSQLDALDFYTTTWREDIHGF